MVSLFGILNIGARGIASAQAALNVTGNNITNADTEGYSRQRVDQTTTSSITLSFGSFGQGSEIVSVERIRDMLLEAQVNDASSDKSYYEKLDSIFTQIEAILSDPLYSVSDSSKQSATGGINNQLSKFFDAFQELSNSPDSVELRTTTVECAISLAQSFSDISTELQQLRQSLDDEVRGYVEEINNITTEIARLNEKISTTEGGSQVNANDLRDQRDLLISQLSEMVPIKVTENSNGTVKVSVEGQAIVDQVSATPLQVEIIQNQQDMTITSIRIGAEGLDTVDDQIRLGKLGAALQARDELIPSLQTQMDELARSIIYEVNQIQSEASGLEGYQEVTSHFNFPDGADEPDTSLTLDSLFNHPVTTSQTSLNDEPFPIQDGVISIRVADEENETQDLFQVEVNTDETLSELVDRIDRCDGIVQTASSALRFDAVYVEKVQGAIGLSSDEITQSLSSLSVLEGTPIAETPGTYSFDIYVQNSAGDAVDANLATAAIDPIHVNINSSMSLQEVASAIQSAGNGAIRAQLVSSDDNPNETVLRIEAIDSGSTISIQSDSSGIIEAFDFPITDPSLPWVGGNATEATATFTGDSNDSLLGSGSPSFNTVLTDPSPTVLEEGSFELVVLDNLNQVVTQETISISSTGIDTLDELAAAIESANSNLSVEITADHQFIITSSNQNSFVFQNDSTGLIDAMGFSEIDGYGKIGDQAFQDGSFEIVVANQSGKVTSIVDVPISADPSANGGGLSLNDLIDQINQACGDAGAPVSASIVTDPTDPTQCQIQIQAENGYEFTFRSDDSLILSALGFSDGTVLQESGATPLIGADETVAVGDTIGSLVRASINEDGQIEISTVDQEQISFVGDTSYFLAASGINALFLGNDAESMSVNEEIIENVNLLGTSSDGNEGNNEAALAMVALQNETVIDNLTLNEYYRSLISGLGSESSRADQFLTSSEDILTELQTLQESNSGVSLDEESVNLIRYQRAYQASAQFISIVDELLNVVLTQIGA